jgi:hypothetical protein
MEKSEMCAQFKSCTSPLTRLGFKPQSHSKIPLLEDWGRFTAHLSGLELLAGSFNFGRTLGLQRMVQDVRSRNVSRTGLR